MKNLSKLIQSKFEEMELMNGILFRANIPGELLWETYLSSFDKKMILFLEILIHLNITVEIVKIL